MYMAMPSIISVSPRLFTPPFLRISPSTYAINPHLIKVNPLIPNNLSQLKEEVRTARTRWHICELWSICLKSWFIKW